MHGRMLCSLIALCLLCVAGYSVIPSSETIRPAAASRSSEAGLPIAAAAKVIGDAQRHSAAAPTAQHARQPAVEWSAPVAPNWDGITPLSVLPARPQIVAADESAKLLQAWVDSPAPEDDSAPVRSTQTLHRQMAKEPVDPKWSASAEAQLRAYFTYMTKDGWVDIISIHCSDALCEVQAASRTPETIAEDVDDWNIIVNSMGEQPWWLMYEFTDISSGSKAGPNGTNLFAVYVHRKVA